MNSSMTLLEALKDLMTLLGKCGDKCKKLYSERYSLKGGYGVCVCVCVCVCVRVCENYHHTVSITPFSPPICCYFSTTPFFTTPFSPLHPTIPPYTSPASALIQPFPCLTHVQRHTRCRQYFEKSARDPTIPRHSTHTRRTMSQLSMTVMEDRLNEETDMRQSQHLVMFGGKFFHTMM